MASLLAAALLFDGLPGQPLTAAEATMGAAATHVGAQPSSSRLKWLPQPPESVQNDGEVIATAYAAPATAPRSIRMAQNRVPRPASDKLSNPFGDARKPKASPAPAEKLDAESMPKMPEEPQPREPLAEPSLTEPAPFKSPYVAPQDMLPLPAPSATQSPSPKRNGRLEEEFAPRQHDFQGGCPSAKDFKKVADLTTNITPTEGDLPNDCPLGKGLTFNGRSFAPLTFAWTASALCHKPLYFEDVQLERYGHMAGPFVQPLASAAHFFLTFPILPYKMGLELPNECMYSLGYYRPGDCAPYMLDPIPLSVRAGLFEAGAWVGGVAAIP
jgi:hypothetical protein